MADVSSEKREYDFIIFGASGFTGQYVVEEMARTIDEEGPLKWAVAGRSMAKLQDVLKQASEITSKSLEELPIEIADVDNEDSIREMCKKTKILLNCVGPYRFYGETVVKICLETKTHHLDISGEPQFLEKVQLLFNEDAQKDGVFIIGACGFDSIPSEMGVQFTKSNIQGQLIDIENYFQIIPGPHGMHGNYATWHSAVESFAHAHELKPIRRQLFPTSLPPPPTMMPKRGKIFYNDDVSAWCVPFVGSDHSIISRTMRHFYGTRDEPTFHFKMYSTFPSFFRLLYMLAMGVVFGIFSKFSFGQWILKTFPGLMSLGNFSKTGPSRKQIETTSFSMNMFAAARNQDGSEKYWLKTRVTGPEVGYITTPICMVQAAYAFLKDEDKLPTRGGVYTAGAAFEQTTLLDRLQKHNIKFEVLDAEVNDDEIREAEDKDAEVTDPEVKKAEEKVEE